MNRTVSRLGVATAATAAVLATLALPGTAQAHTPDSAAVPAIGGASSSRACPPAAVALDFSDSLDKLVYHGVSLGGLSSLAFDRRSGSWVASVDNHAADPARLWFFRNLADPTVTRDPLVLRRPDGTPYDGTTADDEGLAILPDGDFVVSSETEPSIRIFGRDGVQKGALPVPARFAVAPTGEATSNATLEGLTISPDGHEIIAAMEGALAGDVSATGDATAHRFLVYDRDRHGAWVLSRQIAYRTEPGNRVPEVTAYGPHSLLVAEAAFSTTTGNTVDLYAVANTDRAADVSAVANLSTLDRAVPKRLVARLVACPTLNAPSRETQANPLLDNYEGMAVLGGPGLAEVSLISDDNFSATQFTRVLNLAAILP